MELKKENISLILVFLHQIKVWKIIVLLLGLQRRICHLSPHSLYIHCRNHRVALCFAHLLKLNPTMVEVNSVS